MKLYPLLKDRNAVNILKLLYDNEVTNRDSYTLSLSEAKKRLGMLLPPKESALRLSSFRLIAIDSVDNDYIMSITNKGKEFIEVFDQLIELLQPDKVGKKAISIKYELTINEKKILALAYKISRESGMDYIALKTLAQELYPYNQQGKTSIISRYVSKLEEINLMKKKREGRETFVNVTDKGLKTIREQYLKELMR